MCTATNGRTDFRVSKTACLLSVLLKVFRELVEIVSSAVSVFFSQVKCGRKLSVCSNVRIGCPEILRHSSVISRFNVYPEIKIIISRNGRNRTILHAYLIYRDGWLCCHMLHHCEHNISLLSSCHSRLCLSCWRERVKCFDI